MAISDRIEAIEQHLTDDYSVLTLAGADLTNVDKNILNLKTSWKERLLYFMNNGTDVVWNNWDKVTGEGTSISLNNTLEAKMKIVLKGNTYQDSTTGKNLANINNIDDIDSTNLKLVINNDTIILSNNGNIAGYANSNTTMSELCPNLQIGDTIYLFFNTTSSSSNKNIIYLNGYNHSLSNNGGTLTITQEILDSSVCFYGGYQETAIISNFMITKVNNSTYEPYTNGASPNPQYPQEIHVVSGDNSIVVCGKNLAPTDWASKFVSTVNNTFRAKLETKDNRNCLWYRPEAGYNYYPTQNFTLDMTFKENTQYTISFDWLKESVTNPTLDIEYTDGTVTTITSANNVDVWEHKTLISTANKTIKNIHPRYTAGSTYIDIDTWQIEEGTTETTYEAYTGESYPISLGVENLFDINSTHQDGNATSVIVGDTLNITSAGAYSRTDYLDIKVPKTEYKLSFNWSSNITLSGTDARVYIYDGATVGTMLTYSNLVGTSGEITLPFTNTTGSVSVRFSPNNTGTAKTNSMEISNIQIKEGTNRISTQPIELLKIGTYQDKIDKSSGKNLFDIEQFLKDSEATYTKNGEGSYTTQNYSKLYSTPYVFNDTDIPVSLSGIIDNGTATNIRVQLLDSSNNVVGEITSSSSSLVNKSACKLRFNWSTAGTFTFKNIMLNLGTTTLPYEPYGNGDWYLEKNTGKMILNGTENWSIQTSWSAVGDKTNAFYITRPTEINPRQSCYCDYLKYVTTNTIVTTDEYGISYSASLILRMPKTLTDGNALKTYLASNNMKLYYALLNPTYTKIEGTLKDQLNALAKSYEGQTNISQENNDMPSILNATALEEM